MISLNKVLLAGNITRNPELKYISSGQAVVDLSLAVNRIYVDKDNQKHEEVTFVDVVVWGKQAETASKYLKKGSPILVEGSLQYDSWEKDNVKHSKIRIKASRVQFLSSNKPKELIESDITTEET